MSTVSSTSSSTTSSLTAKTGIGGLVSGMDTDELVESLSSRSRQKILKQEQNLQKLQWKQTAYRAVTTALKDFQSSYLDILSSTNLKSSSFFNTVKASTASTSISAKATSSATEGSITIESIKQLATSQKTKSSSPVSKGLVGTISAQTSGALSSSDISSLLSEISGKSISLNLDGKVKTVTFDSEFVSNVNSNLTAEGLTNALQTTIDDAFGITESDRIVNVSITGNELSITASGSQVTVNAVDEDTDTLSALGLESGQSNKLTSTSELKALSFATELDSSVSTYKFTINDVAFEFENTVSLSSVINKINSSDAGVTISYSDIADKFTITSDETGSGNNIVIGDTTGNLMSAFGLTSASNPDVVSGQNAILTVEGQLISRSSNSIAINGITVNLLEATEIGADPIKITMSQDSSELKDTITKFVEDYNTMIDLINTYTKESVYTDYQPLSDDEKSEMTESEIEKWETKSKSGILRGDSILKGIASKMQTLMYTSAVPGGISLYALGITSAGYDENGKLEVDEDKLEAALATKGSEISELFSSETGIAQKLDDIIDGAISTSGAQGSRGTLIDMAGLADTSSDKQNSIFSKIGNIEDLIDNLEDRLSAEETRLWSKFTAMESALSNLNSQSSIITQFTTSG